HVVTPNSYFHLPPTIQVADRTIKEAEDRGTVDLTTAQILAQSSNVGTVKIGLRLGATRFDQWVRRFGFGKPTGIELAGEESGQVIKRNTYSGSSMGNLPIGQGESVTPLQLATAYASIADGGVLRRPRLIEKIGGKPTPAPAGRRVISGKIASQLRTMLTGVTEAGGTATAAAIPGYTIAGKTGTANKIDPATGMYSKTRYIGSFVGFAPARDPKLLVTVMVDEPQGQIFGAEVAAPAFQEIMSFALPYLGIAPG
ncbi:MAG TPA: penicillin-binding transpeptidase domain-containing protein, partial [Solirubrobacteraceae bacterium]